MSFLRGNIEWLVSIALAVCIVAGYQALFAAPNNFSSGTVVAVARGDSVRDISEKLSEAHVIQSSFALRTVLRLKGESSGIQAGEYIFKEPKNVFSVASILTSGEYGFAPVRVTFTEGMTIREMALKATEAFPNIKVADFEREAKEGGAGEGYLFPDTYFFPHGTDARSIVATMHSNFDVKIQSIESELSASGLSLSDVITLASIVEKEARTEENRRIVAGILLNRLKLGMPLQVDAVFGYIFKRDTYSPSFEDLKVDSPYNTYKYKGLPPGPICNPGLGSIIAVIHREETKYLYYLTGKDDQMHYAMTYSAHQANLRKYLQ